MIDRADQLDLVGQPELANALAQRRFELRSDGPCEHEPRIGLAHDLGEGSHQDAHAAARIDRADVEDLRRTAGGRRIPIEPIDIDAERRQEHALRSTAALQRLDRGQRRREHEVGGQHTRVLVARVLRIELGIRAGFAER